VADLHEPVLASEVVERLLSRPDGVLLDGTTGTGGHAEAILQKLSSSGRLICLDQDPDALRVATARLGGQGERVHFHRGSFSALDSILEAEGIDGFDGILLDLGLNSWSLARPEKGLSYQLDGPLRMDLDPDCGFTAADLLARAGEDELLYVFREFGGVRQPRLFVRRILEARSRRTLGTTFDLVRALAGPRPGGISPGELSRIFQALRVATCREMERLETFLQRAGDWVRPGGRLLILTYASHEDRRVKEWARRGAREERLFRPLSGKAVKPGREEVLRNRRARSAKLYSFERGGA
jgi:16S rRNA (cytosine1402-N4)-methyltransferase